MRSTFKTHRRKKAIHCFQDHLRASDQPKFTEKLYLEPPNDKNYPSTFRSSNQMFRMSGRKIIIVNSKCQNCQRRTKQTKIEIKKSLSVLEQKISNAKMELEGALIKQPSDYYKHQIFSPLKDKPNYQHSQSTLNFQTTIINLKSRSKLKYQNYKSKGYFIEEIHNAANGKNEILLTSLRKALEISHILGDGTHLMNNNLQEKHFSKKSEDLLKKSLIIGLEECILNIGSQGDSRHDFQISYVSGDNHRVTNQIVLRPYCLTFLKTMSQYFQIFIFSTMSRQTVDLILNEIDQKQEIIRHALCRNECQFESNIGWMKDIRIINRDLGQMVLVQSSPSSYLLNANNSIPIVEYRGDSDDRQLLELQKYLLGIRGEDLRTKLKERFHLQSYRQFSNVHSLVRELYLSGQE